MCSRTFSVSGTRPTCSMAPSRAALPRQRIGSEYRDAAGIGPRETQQHAHQRGFAGAVRPQQRQQLAGADFKVQVREGDDRFRSSSSGCECWRC